MLDVWPKGSHTSDGTTRVTVVLDSTDTSVHPQPLRAVVPKMSANLPDTAGHPSDIPIVITVGDDKFQIPSNYLNSWLYKENTQVTREMVLVILLDFSTMLLPEFPKVHNAYWVNFVSLFQLLCYMVVVTKEGPRKLSFKCYKEMYVKCTAEGSDDTVYKEEIHGWVYKNFRDMVDTSIPFFFQMEKIYTICK